VVTAEASVCLPWWWWFGLFGRLVYLTKRGRRKKRMSTRASESRAAIGLAVLQTAAEKEISKGGLKRERERD